MARHQAYRTPEEFGEKIAAFFTSCKKKAPTKNGLAHFLGLTTKGLRAYGEREDFKDVLENAYELIEEEWTQFLATKGSNTAGAIFYLKNAFHWRDRQEIEHGATKDLTDVLRERMG